MKPRIEHTVSFNVRVSPRLRRALHQQAKLEDRTVGQVVRRILERGIAVDFVRDEKGDMR